MDWIAAAFVLACLVALAVDFARRGGRLRLDLDPRNPVMWLMVVVGVVVVALVVRMAATK